MHAHRDRDLHPAHGPRRARHRRPPRLRDAAARAPVAAGRVVLLDLCGAPFADSTVVHFAIELAARAREHGSELVIVAPARTRELFTIVGARDLRVVEDEPR